jgi:hypothetical protein
VSGDQARQLFDGGAANVTEIAVTGPVGPVELEENAARLVANARTALGRSIV